MKKNSLNREAVMSEREAFEQRLMDEITKEHGMMLTGQTLYKLLGFPGAEALRQAKHRGLIEVPVFQMPRRRGHFALSRDVAAWLCERRFGAMAQHDEGEKR